MKILIVNGPNLNLLGSREPEIYGNRTFDNYLKELQAMFPSADIDLFQSNIEGEIIDALHAAAKKYDAVLLNAGGYTHTSVAIADAVGAIGIDVVEIHMSSILSREEFRHTSLIAPKCKGSIMGFGLDSYRLGVLSVLR